MSLDVGLAARQGLFVPSLDAAGTPPALPVTEGCSLCSCLLVMQGLAFESVARLVGGGLFTSTNPETRRIMPEAVGGRTRLKVVYVVLEAQYQSALGAAVRNINATNDKARCSPCGHTKHWMSRRLL